MTQRERILKWLKDYGTLTRVEAFAELGIIESPARISELRKMGHVISTTREHGKNRYGEPVSWVKWRYEGTNV